MPMLFISVISFCLVQFFGLLISSSLSISELFLFEALLLEDILLLLKNHSLLRINHTLINCSFISNDTEFNVTN